MTAHSDLERFEGKASTVFVCVLFISLQGLLCLRGSMEGNIKVLVGKLDQVLSQCHPEPLKDASSSVFKNKKQIHQDPAVCCWNPSEK